MLADLIFFSFLTRETGPLLQMERRADGWREVCKVEDVGR